MAKATDKNDINIFAQRLGDLIKENGYTHENVAQGIGVTRQGVGKWVSGESVPDVLTAAKLAKFFNVSVDYISGSSNIKSGNSNIQSICNYLEIDEQTINGLLEIKEQIKYLNFNFDSGDPAICIPMVTGDYYKKCIGYFIQNETGDLITSLIDSYIKLCRYEPKANMFSSEFEATKFSFEVRKECYKAKDQVDLIKYRNYRYCAEMIDRFYKFLGINNNCIDSYTEYNNNITKYQDVIVKTFHIKEASDNGKHNPTQE